MDWEYEAKRNAKLLKVICERLKFLDGYSGNNDTHHGVRLAVALIRSDLNSAVKRIPKKPKSA